MPLSKYIIVTNKDINQIIKKNDLNNIIYKNITNDIEDVKKKSPNLPIPTDSESSESENKSKTEIIDKIIELEKYTLDILKQKQCKKQSCLPRLKSCCNGNNLNVDI